MNYNLIVIGQAKRPIIVRCSKKRVKVMQREKTSRRFWDSVMPGMCASAKIESDAMKVFLDDYQNTIPNTIEFEFIY